MQEKTTLQGAKKAIWINNYEGFWKDLESLVNINSLTTHKFCKFTIDEEKRIVTECGTGWDTLHNLLFPTFRLKAFEVADNVSRNYFYNVLASIIYDAPIDVFLMYDRARIGSAPKVHLFINKLVKILLKSNDPMVFQMKLDILSKYKKDLGRFILLNADDKDFEKIDTDDEIADTASHLDDNEEYEADFVVQKKRKLNSDGESESGSEEEISQGEDSESEDSAEEGSSEASEDEESIGDVWESKEDGDFKIEEVFVPQKRVLTRKRNRTDDLYKLHYFYN
jgi:hypothetical protein